MANVLADLFADIADAIREKTGDPPTARMKPLDFPDKISRIVGIGGGSSSAESLVYAEDSFVPTASRHVIEHNLGVVPDILIVFESTHDVSGQPGSMLKSVVGFGARMTELLKNCGVEYPGKTSYALVYDIDGVPKSSAMSMGDCDSIVDCTSEQENYGKLRSATSTTAVIGGVGDSIIKMNTNTTYKYIAIGGLF